MLFILKGQYKAKIVLGSEDVLEIVYQYYIMHDIDKSDTKAIVFEKVYLVKERYSMDEIAILANTSESTIRRTIRSFSNLIKKLIN